MTTRPTPYTMVFGDIAGERFPAIRAVQEESHADPVSRDVFLMNREAVSLVHDLEPEKGIGEGVAQLAALVHHAYLFWLHGCWVFQMERGAVSRLVQSPPMEGMDAHLPPAYYLQLPRQLLWGQLGPDEPFQPLDGCFVTTREGPLVVALGVFGLHPDRMGFTVVEAEGPYSESADRGAASTAFAPQMEGGVEAGLYSVTDPAELITLVGRAAGPVTQAFATATTSLREIVIP